ncbi:MAG: glycosyltransferase family 1 protein [Nitrospirota bacterium]
MRIGIDARVTKKYPGLGRYCINILRALSKIDRENEYIVFTLVPEKLDFLNEYKNFRIIQVGYPVLSYKTFYAFSRLINKYEPDIFFATFQVAPFNVSCPMVIVLHDMMDLMYKDAFTHHNFIIKTGLKHFFKFAIPMCVKKAAAIITVSESTKHDLLSYFNIDSKKVTAVLEGVEEKFRPVTDKETLLGVKERYGLPDRFILYLGSIKPYKNLDGVLRSFSRLHELTFHDNVKLVISGLKHFSLDKIEAEIERLNIKDKVLRIGFIAEEDLPAVYSLAEVFLFPSIWEGFGLPVLEAMACGTPVITSNTSSLPEVIGDAGIQVNPHNVEDIAYNIKLLLQDTLLRNALSRKGIQRAKTFTWEKAATKTLEIIEMTYQGNRR